MRLAIEQAERVKGATYPNPPVGAVILDSDNEVAGVGATEPPGGPHAEVLALRRAGERAVGGTAVVTLEPCNHHGRTPPCVDALVAAGVSAVAYAVADPEPGGGRRCVETGRNRARGGCRCAGRSGRRWDTEGVAAQAAHRITARDMEIRHQCRRSQRRGGRLQPVDHQRGGARRRAPQARRRRRGSGRHRHSVRGRPVAHRTVAGWISRGTPAVTGCCRRTRDIF